ncbi:kinase-like domain-containing protein [Mycena latifolia]|nr:kinase-like domain-containing protein [Mycena latifolia]
MPPASKLNQMRKRHAQKATEASLAKRRVTRVAMSNISNEGESDTEEATGSNEGDSGPPTSVPSSLSPEPAEHPSAEASVTNLVASGLPAWQDVGRTGLFVYQDLLLFLRQAWRRAEKKQRRDIPGRVTTFERTLEGYLLSMPSDTIVDAIVQSMQHRKTLLKLRNNLGLANDPDFRNALNADEKRAISFLEFILKAKAEEEIVLGLQGNAAQSFLDVVQDALDRGFLMEQEYSSKAQRIIRKLSASSDKLPSSLFIGGVRREEHPSFGGGFADVYRASWNNQTVALKHMRHFVRGDELRRIRSKFCREALLWKDLEHPNILPFIGIDRESFPSSFCMVSPWMEHGTVLNYLNNHGRGDMYRIDKLLYEIAQGLQYLHSCKIVHGDLRGNNILIKQDWSACLADFGLSVLSDATTSSASTHGGSLHWMAPELIDPRRFGYEFARTPASDVYAFGCVCLELYTGKPPFAELSGPAAILEITNNKRPARPAVTPAMSDLLWDKVTTYWAEDPAARPLTDVVVEDMARPLLLRLLAYTPTPT